MNDSAWYEDVFQVMIDVGETSSESDTDNPKQKKPSKHADIIQQGQNTTKGITKTQRQKSNKLTNPDDTFKVVKLKEEEEEKEDTIIRYHHRFYRSTFLCDYWPDVVFYKKMNSDLIRKYGANCNSSSSTTTIDDGKQEEGEDGGNEWGFMLEGEYFRTVEHYFHIERYKKAGLYNFADKLRQIYLADDVKKANTKFRKNRVLNITEKDEIDIMKRGLFAKFSQNSVLKEALLNTKNHRLSKQDGKLRYVSLWNGGMGKDVHGKLLMEVRSMLHSNKIESKTKLPISTKQGIMTNISTNNTVEKSLASKTTPIPSSTKPKRKTKPLKKRKQKKRKHRSSSSSGDISGAGNSSN